MRPSAVEAILLPALLAALFCGSPAIAGDAAPPDPQAGTTTEPAQPTSAAERSLRKAINRIESRDGAYAADLPEQILSLGLALQQQERHGEALVLFKRGVHLARINHGLYCPEQIPLLQGEIRSAIALGDYAQVDALQQYLYRVEMRGLPGGEERASALLQQANWQFNAYQLGVGADGASRLVSMWDLYRKAWSDLNDTEGSDSRKLLPPLYGLLRTQYLISEYREENQPPGSSFSSNYMGSQPGSFYSYRNESYDLGRRVIMSIYNIQRVSRGEDSDEAVDALIALGDWAWWNEKRDDATEIYQQALAELASRDVAQGTEVRQLFTEPVPLPDMKGLRRLPSAVDPEKGNILLEFGVNERGSVTDLERLDTDESMDEAANRLMRVLSGTQFRPRFEAGEPVATEKLVRAYDIKAE
jgi:tetratricopeptide (TPR) repeat protein